MRSLWLASAATLFFAGAACAQTAAPAPTGAPNAATMTAPGQSPGNTGPNPSPAGGTSTPSAAMNNSGTPANNASGVPQAATVTTPGKSSGKTSSAGPAQGSMTTMTPAKPMMASTTTTYTHHHHHYMGSGMGTGGMPANAGANTYLHIAKTSIMHHNKMMAEESLSRAETVMLNRSVPQGDVGPDSSPGVSAVESARKAVMDGDMKTAMTQTDMAMQQSGSGDMSAMPASASMAPPPASNSVGSFKSENMPIAKSSVARVGAAAQHPENLGTTPSEGGAPEAVPTH